MSCDTERSCTATAAQGCANGQSVTSAFSETRLGYHCDAGRNFPFWAPEVPRPHVVGYAVTVIPSQDGNVTEAAANLFAALRRLDAAGLDAVIVEPVPELGLGRAIMDRLRRAATR